MIFFNYETINTKKMHNKHLSIACYAFWVSAILMAIMQLRIANHTLFDLHRLLGIYHGGLRDCEGEDAVFVLAANLCAIDAFRQRE